MMKELKIVFKDVEQDIDFIFGDLLSSERTFKQIADLLVLSDTLDADMDDRICFKEFADLFEPTIEVYEKKGYHMEVGTLLFSHSFTHRT